MKLDSKRYSIKPSFIIINTEWQKKLITKKPKKKCDYKK